MSVFVERSGRLKTKAFMILPQTHTDMRRQEKCYSFAHPTWLAK